MSLKDIKNTLSDEDIIRLLRHLGSYDYITTDDNLIFRTVCHNGKKINSKQKLYYHRKRKNFYCFTHCEGIGDVFNLVEHTLDLDKSESVKYVLKFFNISAPPDIIKEEDYGFDEYIEDRDEDVFLQSVKLEDIEVEPLPPIKRQALMRMFIKYYCKEWLKDGISKETMDKFGIKFSPEKMAVIIPHHNINGEVIGIRVRNLESYVVECFGKYTPLYVGGKMYNHQLGHNLYGLDKNKEAIKRFKKVIIFEGEKSVLQMDTIYGNNSIAVALCGSSMSRIQMKMLYDLGVEEVIFALDKQYETRAEEAKWAKKVERNAKPLAELGVKTTKIWDSLKGGLLGHKDAPIDRGKNVYEKLVKKRKNIEFKEGEELK